MSVRAANTKALRLADCHVTSTPHTSSVQRFPIVSQLASGTFDLHLRCLAENSASRATTHASRPASRTDAWLGRSCSPLNPRCDGCIFCYIGILDTVQYSFSPHAHRRDPILCCAPVLGMFSHRQATLTSSRPYSHPAHSDFLELAFACTAE